MNRRNVLGVLLTASFTTACHKNRTAVQPVITVPPSAPRQTKPKRPQTAASPISPAPLPPPRPPMETPRLGQMLSPDQQRQYNALIDQNLATAQASLRLIGSRKLTREQQESVREIEHFMQEAADARKVDLVGAKGLAEKAEVLAKDLVQTLK